MGKPKKNKKAEIRARRKSRKANERISELKRREKMIKAYLKVIAENAGTLQKLADAEAQEKSSSDSEVEPDDLLDDQNTQSTSE